METSSMAQEGNNNSIRRCSQISEDDELSMVDVLNEQARLQADADAVLGGSDENNCTYPQGYIKRQALYACATCTPSGNAGICLACSYACHEGHDLYELYTKRFFRCDCGNEKFGGKECKLYKDQKELSARNCYNQNFRGAYCTCSRPYPDPEDMVEDEMIQCIMCEDWYHGRHLKTTLPGSDDFNEMTCPDCMSKYDFLWAYNTPRPVKQSDIPSNNVDENVDVCNISKEEKSELNMPSSEIHLTEPAQKDDQLCTANQGTDDKHCDTLMVSQALKRERSQDVSSGIGLDEPPASKKVRLESEQQQEHTDIKVEEETERQQEQTNKNAEEHTDKKAEEQTNKKTEEHTDKKAEEQTNKKAEEETESQCILKSLQKRVIDYQDCAAFWQDGWRSKLCQCGDCLQMYKDKDITFLIDESDTVHAYEEMGRNSASNMSDQDSTASVLAGMNRVQQIEVVRGFMDLKTELNEFLHGFARDGKVVTENDIREFFQRMDQRKKDRMHVLQYSCR